MLLRDHRLGLLLAAIAINPPFKMSHLLVLTDGGHLPCDSLPASSLRRIPAYCCC
jgi:hypothetical protein